MLSRWCPALGCASISLLSGAALAEGARPTVSQLVIDPEDDRHLVLRSNLGLMISTDAGASWGFRCQAGLGYQGSAEPAIAILSGGALLLGVATGVVTGDAAGCDFKPASGIDATVVDVAAVDEAPGAALAVSVSFSSSSSRVWQSLDGGRSFRALGATLERFTALSLAVARASSRRVYMTGLLWASTVQGALAISDDAGKTFSIGTLANSDSGAQPFVAAIHPTRPDTVYLRFTGTPGRLRVSDDAGRTFREVLAIPGPLQGVAISPSGAMVYASSLEAGSYRADGAALSFQRVACDGLPCLAATSTALLGCGERTRDGFIAGRSVDDGRSFAVLLDTPCLAFARCKQRTSVGAACAKDWPHVAARLGQPSSPCNRMATSKPLSRTCLKDVDSVIGGGGGGPSGSHTMADLTHTAFTSRRASDQHRLPTRGASSGCALSHGRTGMADFQILALPIVAFWLRRRKATSGRSNARTKT